MMDDLEMTMLCAKVMGIKFDYSAYISQAAFQERYDPLHDDAQAMALVKKFKMFVAWDSTCTRAIARYFLEGDKTEASANADLNRAIVKCVAKMQVAKK